MREYLEIFLDVIGTHKKWKPLSRPAIAAWLIFFLWFLAYAFNKHGGFLFIDAPNMVVHEGGHALFGWFGATLGLWGGTILQWLVPFLLAIYFFHQGQVAGFIFCLFFFFENWIYTATYMADARALALPLVTLGDPEFAKHDWNTIFTSLGVLQYDTLIAGIVRFLGWCGMLACTAWLANRLRMPPAADPTHNLAIILQKYKDEKSAAESAGQAVSGSAEKTLPAAVGKTEAP